MEEKKTMFDYMSQVFMFYGIMIVILNVFCLLFGEEAKEVSTMFAMGNRGLSISTMAQYFLMSIIIVTLRFLFFTDVFIKEMSVTARTVCMVVLILIISILFILCFGWFPVNTWKAWFGFFVCFGISFLISTTIVTLKEKTENKKMAEALERLKQENNKQREIKS